MRTSIDEIIAQLRDAGALSENQAKVILEFEQRAKTSERSADAEDIVGKMASSDPEKLYIHDVLAKTKNSLFSLMESVPSNASPTLSVVSGAPGSGKSKLCQNLADQDSTAAYLCGDVVKREFMTHLKSNRRNVPVDESDLLKYNDSVFIHRLTSPITWALFEHAVSLKKNVILEMIGTDPESDSQSIIDAIDRGYRAEYLHVACRQDRAISSAIDRFFTLGTPDSGRYISLTNISNKHEIILKAFQGTVEKLRGKDCTARLFDNSNWKMEEIFTSNLKSDLKSPSIEEFISTRRDTGLWYLGENHTADLVVLAYDDAGNLCVASASRRKAPFVGAMALPGGFVYTSAKRGEQYQAGMESAEEAARREFGEKTLFQMAPTSNLIKVGIYQGNNRDPRDNNLSSVVSNAFAIHCERTFPLIAGSDVGECRWINVSDILNGKDTLAFDHNLIVDEAVKKLGLELQHATQKLKVKYRSSP